MTDLILDTAARAALLDRFLRYVRVHTNSSETSDTFPSTPGQWDLLRMLEGELRALGLTDVELDEHGYLFATLPANLPDGQTAPTIGMLAHVDTYPGTCGQNVKPQVIDYAGGDIALPGDSAQVISGDHPLLKRCVGHQIVTSDGTTLLGADDKAGIAIIMTIAEWLLAHPEVKHGAIRIGFTPDEEIGAGTRFFDVAKFGAQAAYTFDGSELGEGGQYADLIVAGFDAGATQKNAVRNGWFVGSVTQDPFQIGYKAVELAYKAYMGEAVADVDTGAQWYTAENIDNPDIALLVYD